MTKLARLIANSGMRLYQIAGIIGIATGTLSRYKDGLAYPSPRNLVKLCYFFQVPPETILEDLKAYKESSTKNGELVEAYRARMASISAFVDENKDNPIELVRLLPSPENDT